MALTVKACLISLLLLFVSLMILQATKSLETKDQKSSPQKVLEPVPPIPSIDGRQLFEKMKSQFVGDQYFNISSVKSYKELPLCVLTKPQLSFTIPKQSYSNYVIKILPRNNMNYDELETFIEVNCFERQLVMIVEQELEEGAFSRINDLFQRFNVWSAYLES